MKLLLWLLLLAVSLYAALAILAAPVILGGDLVPFEGGLVTFAAGLVAVVPSALYFTWVWRLPSLASALNILVGGTCIVFLLGQIGFDQRIGGSLVAQTERDLDQLQNMGGDLGGLKAAFTGPVAEADLLPVLPVLDTLRKLPVGYIADTNFGTTLTLVGPDQLATASVRTYRAGLNNLMLPRLLLRLEDLMWTNITEPQALYDPLKAYLMLGQEMPMNVDYLRQFFRADWVQTYPDYVRGVGLDELDEHLQTLVSFPMVSYDLNGLLVEQARETLLQVPLSERIYQTLLDSPEAQALPEFTLTEAGGPSTARVFQRASGARLDEGVPGIFTYDGFYSVFLPEMERIGSLAATEILVLGAASAGPAEDRLGADIVSLYTDDYVAHYDSLIGDLDMVPVVTAAQAADMVGLLADAEGPMFSILEAIATQTHLTDQSNLTSDQVALVTRLKAELEIFMGNSAGQALAGVSAGAMIDRRAARAELSLMRDASAALALATAPQWIEDRFAEVNSVTTQEELGNRLRVSLNIVSAQLELTAALAEGDSMLAPIIPLFERIGQTFPPPVSRWTGQFAKDFRRIGSGSLRAEANSVWQSQVYPVCEAAILSYPLAPDASVGIPIADFERLFAEGGFIDGFFDEFLAEHVDRSQSPWRMRENSPILVSDTVLRQFELAASIRTAFYESGPLGFTFTGALLALDPTVQSVALTLNGERSEFSHNATGLPVPFAWQGGAETIEVAFVPEFPGAENSVTFQGAWALFRLIQSANVRVVSENRMRATFFIGQRQVVFELVFDTATNPLLLPALTEFSCPRSL